MILSSPHLWVALSPHGFGHATMTAPLVAELRRRRPDLRLTIQTGMPRDFLATRYDDFEHVTDIPDFGFVMTPDIAADVAASAERYLALHADFPALVAREAERLRSAAPDLVLANVPYVTIAAAEMAGIPVVAFSSLNWADLADHFFADLPQCQPFRAEMRAAYAKAELFLRPQPAQNMSLPNIRDIGPVARLGADRRSEIRNNLRLEKGVRVGMIAFGGVDPRLDLERWPKVPGWFWLSTLAATPEGRPDMARWQKAGVPFADLFASVDLIVGKPGYGTFSEAGLAGVPVLYEPRSDWPEAPPLERWLARHCRCLPTTARELTGGLEPLLHKLFSLPDQSVAVPSGIAEGVAVLEDVLDRRSATSMAVEARRDHDAAVSNGGGE